MYNCTVYRLKNYGLHSCRELVNCTVIAANGEGSENILHSGKTLLQVVM
jgi:hypothetical protein